MNDVLLLVVVSFSCLVSGTIDNFPSLLNANATIAIVIDKEYMVDEYAKIKDSIEKYFVFSKREILKHGGINVQYFSWTSINVKRDFTAILSIASCADTWKLFKAAADENILFMSISEPDCPRLPSDLAVTVPLLKNGEEVPQIFLDFRSSNAYNWKSVIILYDNTLDRDMVNRVAKSLTGHTDFIANDLALSLLKLGNETSEFRQKKIVSDILSKISTKQLGNNFLVVVKYQYVNTIMEVAKNLGLVNPYTQWFYAIANTNATKSDISMFSYKIEEGNNIAFIYNATSDNNICKSGIQCHSEELLESFTTALESAIKDEISLSNQVSEEEWEAIRPTKPERRNYLLQRVKAHLTTSGTCANCTQWLVKSSDTWGRSFIQNHTQELLPVGSWRPSDGVSFTDVLFPHIAHKFRGRVLPLITYHNPPWQILTLNETGSITQSKGLVFDIIKELSRRLNFTYTVELSKSSNMNDTDQDNSLIEITNSVPDEIIEAVRSRKVMLAACAFTITTERKQIINFTTPISSQTHTFLVARPRQLSRVLLFTSPFTYDTWLCLGLSVITMGPILYYINHYSPAYECRGKVTKGLSGVQSCIWYMYGALLQQGGMYLPEVDSARIVVGTWWLVVLVVATTYCGNLVAFLTFPKIDIPIRTIEDLLEHRDTVTWGTIRGTYLEDYLKEADEPRYRALYQGLILHEQITEEIIYKVRQRNHIFIGWKTRIAYIMKKNYIETGACEFAFGSDEFLDEQIAIIVAQDSPYLPMINEEIIRLHQVGLIEKWLKDYLPKRDRCWKVGHVSEVDNHTVNIDDMQGCFFVLFLGFALATLLIVIEKLYHRRKLKKTKSIIKPFIS